MRNHYTLFFFKIIIATLPWVMVLTCYINEM